MHRRFGIQTLEGKLDVFGADPGPGVGIGFVVLQAYAGAIHLKDEVVNGRAVWFYIFQSSPSFCRWHKPSMTTLK